MEYIYAALLLHKAGKEITEDSILSVLNAAGVDVNENRVKALISALDGVDIEEAISKAAFTPVSSGSSTISEESNNNNNNNDASVQKEKEAEDHSEEDGMAGLGALFG